MTKDDVQQAMESLVARGEGASIKNIRKELGHGSHEDISKHRRAILAEHGGDDMAGKLQTGDALKLIDKLKHEGVPDAEIGKQLHERFHVVPSELVTALNTPEAQRVVDPTLHDRLMTDEHLIRAAKMEPMTTPETPPEPIEEPEVPQAAPQPATPPPAVPRESTPFTDDELKRLQIGLDHNGLPECVCSQCSSGRKYHWISVGSYRRYEWRLNPPAVTRSLTPRTPVGVGAAPIIYYADSDRSADEFEQFLPEPDTSQTAHERELEQRRRLRITRTGGGVGR
jgi:hypothetical protein